RLDVRLSPCRHPRLDDRTGRRRDGRVRHPPPAARRRRRQRGRSGLDQRRPLGSARPSGHLKDPNRKEGGIMKAVVFHGPGEKAWEGVPEPKIVEPGDAIVRVDTTTICGTDLHILKGDVPAVTDGRILGHEGVGTVEEVGSGVTTIQPGDRVLISCISACGRCRYCRVGAYGQCRNEGGWILGHLIDGTQAEYVRLPYADTSTYKVPDGVPDETLLMLWDSLGTGYEVGVLNGKVQPGASVAVGGAGPIGLSVILGARLFSPQHVIAIDLAGSRLEAAKQFGATEVINNSDTDPLPRIQELTDGLGV